MPHIIHTCTLLVWSEYIERVNLDDSFTPSLFNMYLLRSTKKVLSMALLLRLKRPDAVHFCETEEACVLFLCSLIYDGPKNNPADLQPSLIFYIVSRLFFVSKTCTMPKVFNFGHALNGPIHSYSIVVCFFRKIQKLSNL